MDTSKKWRHALTFLVLNFLLDILDRVRRLDVERDSLAGQGLHKDLHSRATLQSHHQVNGLVSHDSIVGHCLLLVELELFAYTASVGGKKA